MPVRSFARPVVCFIASASWRRASSSENHLPNKEITPADSGRNVSAVDAAADGGTAGVAPEPEDAAALDGEPGPPAEGLDVVPRAPGPAARSSGTDCRR